MPSDDFLGKTLLIFTAHPDDETFGMAGTIWENQKMSGRTHVICATFGEKGSSHLAKSVSERQLKAIRRGELMRAARLLKVTRVYPLNLPDGKLHTLGARLYREGLRIAKRIAPDALLSFGRFGMSGHLDHISVGRAARRVASELNIPLFTLTIPPELVADFVERIKLRRRNPHYTNNQPVFEKPTVRVAINSKMKLRAALLHKSQLDNEKPFASLPPALRRLRLKAEYFALQRPL